MSKEEGQSGGPDQQVIAMAALRSVSRDAAGSSSTEKPELHDAGWLRGLLLRLLHLWFFLSRGMTMGVRAMVLDQAGQVFLVRHAYVPGWHLPGGGIEHGQDARKALEMELREEGNIILDGEPVLFGIYFNTGVTRRDHVVLYVVRAFHQTEARKPDYEIVESGFFGIDALPEGTTRSTRRRLQEVLCQEMPARIW